MAFLVGWEEFGGFLHLMDEEGGRVLGCHAHVLQDVDVLPHVHVHVHKDYLLAIVSAHVSQLKLDSFMIFYSRQNLAAWHRSHEAVPLKEHNSIKCKRSAVVRHRLRPE
jgi:hypothetical protein